MRTRTALVLHLTLSCLGALLPAQDPAGESADAAAQAAMNAWFATAPAGRGPVPAACAAITGLTRAQAEAWRARVWASYRSGAEQLGWADDLVPAVSRAQLLAEVEEAQRAGTRFRPVRGVIEVGEGRQMPYVLLSKGERPADGWPLFLSMHGGGRSSRRQADPHGWDVNSREWLAQIQLFLRVYPDGLYFIPRMVDDNDGRWYWGYNNEGFCYALRRALLFGGVDPNRVYMMGISEGGYGTDGLATYMTDRLAAACSMAAGSGPDFTENLRNLPYRTDVGENDHTYDRRALAQRCHDRLEALRVADPGGYVHVLAIQPGRGHGIDYAPGPAWLVGQVRDPHPTRVVWTVRALHQGAPARASYWLGLAGELPDRAWLCGEIDREANRVRITAHEVRGDEAAVRAAQQDPSLRQPLSGCTLRLHLGDALLDLDRVVTVVLNDQEVLCRVPSRGLAAMLSSLADRGDPEFLFPVVLDFARP